MHYSARGDEPSLEANRNAILLLPNIIISINIVVIYIYIYIYIYICILLCARRRAFARGQPEGEAVAGVAVAAAHPKWGRRARPLPAHAARIEGN